MIGNFKDVTETLQNRFAESPLGKQLENIELENDDKTVDSSLVNYLVDIPHDLYDDNGNLFQIENGNRIPNNMYVLDEVYYKTDDNGDIYCIDGKLLMIMNGLSVVRQDLYAALKILAKMNLNCKRVAQTVDPTTKEDILLGVI